MRPAAAMAGVVKWKRRGEEASFNTALRCCCQSQFLAVKRLEQAGPVHGLNGRYRFTLICRSINCYDYIDI